jgi:hypothetical protein
VCGKLFFFLKISYQKPEQKLLKKILKFLEIHYLSTPLTHHTTPYSILDTYLRRRENLRFGV